MTEHAAVGFTAVFPDHKLAQMIRDGDNAALEAARTDNGGDRRCSVAFLPKWTKPLWDVVETINAKFFGFDLDGIELPQYALYREGDYFGWHLDRGADTPKPRKLSLTLQLSHAADYDGGDLEVVTGCDAVTAKHARGSVLAFPSFMLHRVTPITRGERRSMVVWATGPAFR